MLTYDEVIAAISTMPEDEWCTQLYMSEDTADYCTQNGIDVSDGHTNNLFYVYKNPRSAPCTPTKITNIHNIKSVWISPQGDIYNAEIQSHYSIARALGFYSVTRMEEKGWLHISFCQVENRKPIKMSEQMYNAVKQWCEINYAMRQWEKILLWS